MPLLEPVGQFGTRLSGGKDAASARYIFTKSAMPLVRSIFTEADDAILDYRLTLTLKPKNLDPNPET